MSLNWCTVRREDVLEAISMFDKIQPSYGNPKGLYVLVDSGKYPAKFIRMLAYNIRNDSNISEDSFKGGSYTVGFFNTLGFDVEDNGVCYFASNMANAKTNKTKSNYNGKVKSSKGSSTESRRTGRIRMSTKNVLEQKNALQLILNKIFDGDIVNEKSFEWMRTPEEPETTYPGLYRALRDYRGFDSFAGKGRSLVCDFVSESNGVIIEYDERQHFSQARLVSLQAYPDVTLYFDKDKWIRASRDIQAVDNTPPDRDEARAYYDSIRDIEAYNHGYKLIRIMHDEVDFEGSDALEYVEKLIGRYLSHDFGTKSAGNTSQTTVRANNKIDNDKQRMSTSNQKNTLQLILNRVCDNDLVCEKAFEWLRTPENPRKYPELYDSLREYNNSKPIGKNDYRLHCDFVSESNKLIIEYDERGHFTEARRISLLNYPNVELHYDKDKWIKKCEDTKAKTNSRYNSSVARAYYDSIRDIEAYNHGYRLIRIMHGEFDFERSNAVEYVRTLIQKDISGDKNMKKDEKVGDRQDTTVIREKNNIDLKIGMYIQSEDHKNSGDFKIKMREVAKEDYDILVFPEYCYTPFYYKVKRMDVMEDDLTKIHTECLKLSHKIGKSVVVSLYDCNERYFSIYANDNALKDETRISSYFKNTMTGNSFLGDDDYNRVCLENFPLINYKGYKLGLTICNDGNHAPFSRMYGLRGVDVLLNSSGGDVKYKKWYTYHKTRSIENNCFSLVTMGGSYKKKNFTYAFNPYGGMILPENLAKDEEVPSTLGRVYVYDLATCDMNPKPEKYIDQKETINKEKTFKIPVGDINSIINKSKKITDNIYKHKTNKHNIIFILVNGKDILKPELVIPQLYDKKLSKTTNKKYIIIDKFEEEIDRQFYEDTLSVVLKARTTENYATLLLESDNINKCYQPTHNHDAQVVQSENGVYHIDIERATGPEAIWRNKNLMRKDWRKGFETLIEKMVELSR